MRGLFINNSMNFIKKNCNYDQIKLEEIKYGLEAIYILITKTIIILSVAFILGLLNEVIIFTLSYSLIRLFSFGLHATKSWICLITSLVIFLIMPLFCKNVDLNIFIKALISIINILFIYKNAPADTHKRPIVNKKRRERYKFLSTIVAILMSLIAFFINNSFLSNCLIMSIVVQNFMISPTIYKLFKLPYDNYKKYLNEV